MAKFSGKDMTLTLGGNAITCLTNVETTEEIDILVAECAASADKTHIATLKSASMTVNLLLDADDVTELGYFDPGDAGAVRVDTHVIRDGEDFIDVPSIELIHRQNVATNEIQSTSPY